MPSHRIVLNVLKECLYCLACVGESSDIERFPVGIDTLTEFNLREWLIQIFSNRVQGLANDVFNGFQREAHALRVHDDVHVFFRQTDYL